jgi:superfamily I DNA and/or RNA helicase
VGKGKCGAEDMGVVCECEEQRTLLGNLIANDRVEIGEVRAFEGREKEFIVWSLVGAEYDEKEICVGLSRARYGLVMIGEVERLKERKVWMRMFGMLREEQAVVDGEFEELKEFAGDFFGYDGDN